LYGCIYDVWRSTVPATKKLPTLQRYKAKLVSLKAGRRNKILLHTQEYDKLDGEEPSPFHVLKKLQRREAREIRQVIDLQGKHTTFRDITATFVSHLNQKCKPIDVNGRSIVTVQNFLQPVRPTTYASLLEQPIAYDEFLAALRAGARRKTPGIDSLSLEGYTVNWDTILTEVLQFFNHMFLYKHISQRQKHGIVVCLPERLPALTLQMTIAQSLSSQLNKNSLFGS